MFRKPGQLQRPAFRFCSVLTRYLLVEMRILPGKLEQNDW